MKKIFLYALTIAVCFSAVFLGGCGVDTTPPPPSTGGPGGGGGGGGGGGASVPSTISVVPDSSSIIAGSSTNLRATVRDQSGIAMSGISVTFSIVTGAGTLVPATGMATTDATGQAVVRFTSTTTPGPVGIQATVASVTPSLTSTVASIAVTATAVADPSSLSMSSLPTDIDVGGQSSISVIVRDNVGNLLSNKGVNFTFTAGGTLGVLSAATATTNVSGQATITFVAGTTPGTVTIRATATGFPVATSTASVRINSLPASISATVANSSISVKSSTNITAQVLNSAGQMVSDGTVVTFAALDTLGGTLTASATTVGGYASATYLAGNTPGQVTISISCATGAATPATVIITVQQPTIGSIEFISATPNIIGVKSAGTNVTSTVTFIVKTTTGGDAPDGTQVRFNMTGPNGGEYIGDPDATPTMHDASTTGGEVSIIVNSGDVAGPVRIIATVLGIGGAPTNVTTATAAVSIGGGFPSARHLSMATSRFNLPGLVWYGRDATVTVYVADRFGNYNVMPATTVSFYIEAGAVDTSNITDAVGTTTAIVRTQGPEPQDVAPLPWELPVSYTATPPGASLPVTYNPRDGWVRVIAITRGEEKFMDLNANGLYDFGEPFDDLGEPFIDANGNGIRDGLTEPFTDTNGNAKYDRGEPFTDDVVNGVPGVHDEAEFYIDTNKNGSYDGPNGDWDTDINIWTGMDLVFTGTPIVEFSIPRYDVCASTYEPYYDANGDGTVDPLTEPFSDVNHNGLWDSISTAPPCQDLDITVHDINMNNITGGSALTITTSAGTLSSGTIAVDIADGLSFGPYTQSVTICDNELGFGDSEFDTGPQSGGIKVDVNWDTIGTILNVQRTLSGTAY